MAKSNKELAKEIIDSTYKQRVADNEANAAKAIKDMKQGVENRVARSGMNFSSLAGTMSGEGEAEISSEALRNKNLLDISHSQQLLNWMKEYNKPAAPAPAAFGGRDDGKSDDSSDVKSNGISALTGGDPVQKEIMKQRIYNPNTPEGDTTSSGKPLSYYQDQAKAYFATRDKKKVSKNVQNTLRSREMV